MRDRAPPASRAISAPASPGRACFGESERVGGTMKAALCPKRALPTARVTGLIQIGNRARLCDWPREAGSLEAATTGSNRLTCR
jgi:hypothetical protein